MAPGEIVGVIGPNASGKTTLIRLLSGSAPADARRDPARGPIARAPDTGGGGDAGGGGAAGRAARFSLHGGGAGADGPISHAPGRFFESVRGPESRRRGHGPGRRAGRWRASAAGSAVRRRAPARHAGAGAGAGAAAARPRRADRPSRPALSGRSASACSAGSNAGQGSRWSWSPRPRSGRASLPTGCSCSPRADRYGKALPTSSSTLWRSRPPMAVRSASIATPGTDVGASMSSGRIRRRYGEVRPGGRHPRSGTAPVQGKPVEARMSEPNPARSRHCEWGARVHARDGTVRAEATGRGPGKAGPSSADPRVRRPARGMSTSLSRQKERSCDSHWIGHK